MIDTDIHFYEPAKGHGLPHDPFNAMVGPRPIGWISSHDALGRLNLAPYSFFNAFNYVPPIVGFASIGYKDTVRNVQATGEFVWNLATRDLAEVMNQSCAAVPPEVSEFDLTGLTPLPSTRVRPPRVAESPVTFECRSKQILQLQGVDGAQVDTWLVLGRGGGRAHRHHPAEKRRVRHRQRWPHPARRRPGGLFHGGAGAVVQDVPAAVAGAASTVAQTATTPAPPGGQQLD